MGICVPSIFNPSPPPRIMEIGYLVIVDFEIEGTREWASLLQPLCLGIPLKASLNTSLFVILAWENFESRRTYFPCITSKAMHKSTSIHTTSSFFLFQKRKTPSISYKILQMRMFYTNPSRDVVHQENIV